MKIFESLLNFFFPPHCPQCGGYVKARGDWCPECLEEVLHPHQLRLDSATASIYSGGIWALGAYKTVLRELLKALKYHKRRSVLPGLHHYIQAGLQQIDFSSLQNVLVVPVPLHKERLRKRGFNQVELLFREPMAQRGIPMVLALARQRNTAPQFGLRPTARRANLQDAFALAVEPGQIAGKDIILVDDIMTTGSTMFACGKILLEAGARSLTGLVTASGRREKAVAGGGEK